MRKDNSHSVCTLWERKTGICRKNRKVKGKKRRGGSKEMLIFTSHFWFTLLTTTITLGPRQPRSSHPTFGSFYWLGLRHPRSSHPTFSSLIDMAQVSLDLPYSEVNNSNWWSSNKNDKMAGLPGLWILSSSLTERADTTPPKFWMKPAGKLRMVKNGYS